MPEDDVADALARLQTLDPDDPNVTLDRERTDMRRIGAALYAVDIAHTVLVRAVANARHHGRSWTEIANVLGVSRQAARQRFGKEVAEIEYPEIPEAAVQKLLDAGFSAEELDELITLLGFAQVVGDAGHQVPVGGMRMSTTKQRALQEFIETVLPEVNWSRHDTSEPSSVG